MPGQKESVMSKLNLCLVILTFVVAGCNGFGGYPVSPVMGGDAGPVLPGSDGGPMPRPEPDSGPAPDGGSSMTTADAGMPVTGCEPGTQQTCTLACGHAGHIDCDGMTGRYDGACLPFAGFECPSSMADAGVDAAVAIVVDAGTDSGADAFVAPATDAGTRDTGTDAAVP